MYVILIFSFGLLRLLIVIVLVYICICIFVVYLKEKKLKLKKNTQTSSFEEETTHLIEFRVCGKQYNGSTMTQFRARAITTKAHIIFGKNKIYQIKPVTRNVFKNVIFRVTITGFVTVRS